MIFSIQLTRAYVIQLGSKSGTRISKTIRSTSCHYVGLGKQASTTWSKIHNKMENCLLDDPPDMTVVRASHDNMQISRASIYISAVSILLTV